jgi:hypothetical protein
MGLLELLLPRDHLKAVFKVTTHAEMEFKSSVSLSNHDINVLKNIYKDLDLRIQRVNQNVGRVYVVDQGGNSQPLPIQPNGQPVITMADRAGVGVAAYNNEFLYVFGDSFTVSVNGNTVVRLDMQKQHSLMAARNVHHEQIEGLAWRVQPSAWTAPLNGIAGPIGA